MKKLAVFNLISTEKGGRKGKIKSGYRPSIKIEGDLFYDDEARKPPALAGG